MSLVPPRSSLHQTSDQIGIITTTNEVSIFWNGMFLQRIKRVHISNDKGIEYPMRNIDDEDKFSITFYLQVVNT